MGRTVRFRIKRTAGRPAETARHSNVIAPNRVRKRVIFARTDRT
jgi:hypothetical protein